MGITTGIIMGLQGIGTAMNAFGQYQQGQSTAAADSYAAAVARNNATIAMNNARYASQAGYVNEYSQGLKNRANVGAIKAAFGARGVDVNTGSAADVQESARELGQFSSMTIRSNAAREAYGYKTQSAGYEAQAALDTSAAKYAKEAGLVSGLTSLVGGGISGYNEWQQLQQAGVGSNMIGTSDVPVQTSVGGSDSEPGVQS